MAVTSQMIVHTPLAGSGLSIPDANKQREFAIWVEAKSVRPLAWTTWMGPGSEVYELNDIEIGQSYNPFVATTLGAEAGASDEQLTFASTALLRAGDQIEIQQYFAGSTTEFDHTKTETATILTIDSALLATVERHENAVADGSYTVHASGSVVTVKGSAVSYNDPFRDGITFRGDSITQHRQIFENGELTYAKSARSTPDFEAPNGHYMKDVMYAKEDLPYKRNWAFINGVKRTGSYLVTPKIPYRMGGAIWMAEQVSTNLQAINGLLNLFDFSDIYEDLATNHKDGPGDTVWMAPRMVTIWSEMLEPYKGMFGPNETKLTRNLASVRSAFGTTDSVMHDNQWPPAKILITSKADWKWGHAQDFDWTYVERTEKELGAFSFSWNMGGEFSMTCNNITHQRLLTGVETRKELYPARSAFL